MACWELLPQGPHDHKSREEEILFHLNFIDFFSFHFAKFIWTFSFYIIISSLDLLPQGTHDPY